MIFAREVDDNLTSLVKKLDTAVTKNKSARLRAFVVVLNEDAEAKLKKLKEKSGIKNVSLAVDSPAGPRGYNIAKDADVTVILYKRKRVVINNAYTKGKFDEKAVSSVIDNLPKILN